MTTKKDKVLVTTAIDYTNDVIHIGHAYQKILADCIARYYRLKLGNEKVYFLTGTDEYGTTNEKAAKACGLEPKQHVDEISAKDREQLDVLNVSYDRFFRTTDSDHAKVASEFYSKVLENGDIYKDMYTGLYCESCESYKTFSELNEDGQCLVHYYKEIQEIKEENYFFRWSKYADFLRGLVTSPRFVLPEGKKKEMLAFIENGIKDIPVTRPKYKVSWGITAPNDPEQVIYVWFDALINYYTAAQPKSFWDDSTEIIHILGKDNAKWHVLLWPAMLKSAGIRVPDTIYVHGFINLEGQKISKSRGNVILPSDLVNKYGADTVRYYFLKHGPIVEDVDISLKHLEEVYNADLANGLGNTVARLAKLAENSGLDFPVAGNSFNYWEEVWPTQPVSESFRVDVAIRNVWNKLANLDHNINEDQPWKLTGEDLKKVLTHQINQLRIISELIEPFIPETAKKIQTQFASLKIKAQSPLFPRLV